MAPGNNWMDQHFGEKNSTNNSTPPAPKRGMWLYVIPLTLGLFAGIAYVDYSGMYKLGMVPDHWRPVVNQQAPFDPTNSPGMVQLSSNDNNSVTPAPTSQGVVRASDGESQNSTGLSAQYNFTTTTNEQTDQKKTVADEPTAAEKRKADYLDDGIRIMSKELNINLEKQAELEKKFVMRPRPRTKPWTSAEVIDEANIYLRTTNLTPHQRLSATDAIRDAQASLTNARNRINELKEVEASLERRLQAANEKREQIQVP